MLHAICIFRLLSSISSNCWRHSCFIHVLRFHTTTYIGIIYAEIRIIVRSMKCNYRCGPCDSKCESCTGPNADQCITCKSGYFELKGTCHSKCPDFYYPDQKRHECLACPAGCVACNSTACHACDQNFSLNKKGRCLKTGSQQCQPGKNKFILTIFTIICLHFQKCYVFCFSSWSILDWYAVSIVSRFLWNVQRFFRWKLPVVSITDHVSSTWYVRGTVFCRLLSRLAVRQLRDLPTVPASVHRMCVPHELYHVPLAITLANRPVSYDMCPRVCLNTNVFLSGFNRSK